MNGLIEGLIYLLISLLVLGVVYWIFIYVLSLFPVPGPVIPIVRIIFALIALLIVLNFLLPFAGISGYGYHHRLVE